MAVVNLLGDSIIDNKVYVGPHELSVTEHLHNLTDDVINSIAVDGHTTKDVIHAQLDKCPTTQHTKCSLLVAMIFYKICFS